MAEPPSPSSCRAGPPAGGNQATDDATLADLGEWELIRRLGAFAPAGQFADDAALLPAAGTGAVGMAGSDLVINTDVLVEGLHFSEATTEPADVGWRAAAANLSDLAAMGCSEVVGITVGLVAPAATPWSWVEGVYRGLSDALAAYGGVLLGGDCSGGMQRMLAVAAVGRLPAIPGIGAGADGCGPWGAIRRGDGRPGDALVCTGPHGLSRLGLALLQGNLAGLERIAAEAAAELSARAEGERMKAVPLRRSGTELPPPLPVALVRQAIEAHRRPQPRFDAVRALHRCRPEGVPWRVAGCDSSDGLAAAAAAIAGSSNCGALLNPAALPLEPAMAGLEEAEAWCLGGGEDFELVLALAPVWAEALVACLPGTRVIGELVGGAAGTVGWSDGRPWPQDTSGIGGFRHFG